MARIQIGAQTRRQRLSARQRSHHCIQATLPCRACVCSRNNFAVSENHLRSQRRRRFHLRLCSPVRLSLKLHIPLILRSAHRSHALSASDCLQVIAHNSFGGRKLSGLLAVKRRDKWCDEQKEKEKRRGDAETRGRGKKKRRRKARYYSCIVSSLLLAALPVFRVSASLLLPLSLLLRRPPDLALARLVSF